jgi:hypothetical protein
VLKKIGIFTIFGLILLIFSGFLYFFSFPHFSQDSILNMIFPQDILIGILGIGGILFGFLVIVIDFQRVKKRDIINEIHSELIDVGKIMIAIIIALIIDTIIYTNYIAHFGFILGGLICPVIILPLVLIGVGILLIFIRTPLGKSFTNKKVNVFYVILTIVLILFPTTLIWPSISPTYMGRQPINQLHLSSDGNFVLSISGGVSNLAPKSDDNRIYDYIIWNTTSGKPIWNITTRNYNYINIRISPDGKYVEDPRDQTIRSIASWKTLTSCSGMPYDWSANGDFFIKADSQSIYLLSTSNYSVIQTIPVNGTVKTIALSYDGSKIAVEVNQQQNTSLILIDVPSKNSVLLYDFSTYSYFEINFLSWSNSRNQLQMIEHDFTRNSSLSHFNQIIWNVSDNNTIAISTIKDLGNVGYIITDTIFSKYITNDRTQSQLKVYDLGGSINVFPYEKYVGQATMSSDGNSIAYSNEGLIKIINTTTGKTIRTLYPPQYELVRMIPGFEMIIFLCAFLLFIFWKHRQHFRRYF